MPAGRAEPAQHRIARRLLVEVHRLRIELRRKADDLLARDTPRPVFGPPGSVEIFEIILRHSGPFRRTPAIPRRAHLEASTGAWCNAALTSAWAHAVSAQPKAATQGEGHVLYRRPVPVGAVHHPVDHQALLLAGRDHGGAR